jgi:hypothetical protein
MFEMLESSIKLRIVAAVLDALHACAAVVRSRANKRPNLGEA